MLDILLFPFKLVFGLLEGIFSFIGNLFGVIFDLIGGVFGLVGGLVGFGIKVFLICLVISAIVGFVRRHRVQEDDDPQQEEFISYYDKNAVQ